MRHPVVDQTFIEKTINLQFRKDVVKKSRSGSARALDPSHKVRRGLAPLAPYAGLEAPYTGSRHLVWGISIYIR